MIESKDKNDDAFTFDIESIKESIDSGVIAIPDDVNDIDKFEEWLEKLDD